MVDSEIRQYNEKMLKFYKVYNSQHEPSSGNLSQFCKLIDKLTQEISGLEKKSEQSNQSHQLSESQSKGASFDINN